MNVITGDRLKWTDTMWAYYLGCSINEIPLYRQILSKNFVARVRQCPANRRYIFELFQKVVGPKGHGRMRYVYSDWCYQYSDPAKEVQFANEYISNMVFRDEVAARLKIPKKSFQMMLIHEK